VTGMLLERLSRIILGFCESEEGWGLGAVRLLIAGRLRRPAKFGSVGGRYPVRVNPKESEFGCELEIPSVGVGRIR
jgi:hypothetical protein